MTPSESRRKKRAYPAFFAVFLLLAMPLKAQDTASYIWRQSPGGALLCPPQVQEDSVTVLCEGGILASYSAGGNLLWKYKAQGRQSPYLSCSPEGTSYICGSRGSLIAVSRTGRELWRKNLETAISAPVLIGRDGRIFVFTSQRVRCFTASGYPLWSRYLSHQAALRPRLDQSGGVMLILENKQLVELSPFGRIVSRQLAVMPAATLPLPPIPQKPGEAASGGNQVLLIMPDGSAAVSRWGAPEISLPPLKGLPLAVEVRGDKAAVALSGGVLTLLSLPGGEALWSNEASSLNEASSFGETRLSGKAESGGVRILYDSRGIYVLSAKGAACFSEDGKRLWSMTIDRAASGPALSRGGYLYSGGEDWILYAYKPENRTAGPEFSLDGSFAEAAYTAEDPRLFFRTEGYFINFDVEEVEARLDFISQKIRSGTIGSDEMEFTAYLMELAGSPGPNPSREALLHPEIRPDHREEALRLLGFLGSRETVPFLAALYSRERDDAIKAAAASAICRIGLDPEGRALRAFTASVLPPVSYRDKRVLSAVIAAAGAVCRTSPPELSEIGVRLLVALGQDGYPVSIQKLARAELSALR